MTELSRTAASVVGPRLEQELGPELTRVLLAGLTTASPPRVRA